MAILARYPERHFSPCPEGLHHAVCVDVVDLGEVDTNFGRKYRVRLVWQIDEVDPATGRRYNSIKSFTNSLHQRATLRADLESWRGRKLTEPEAKRFDLETLIGVNAMLHVIHETSDDGTVYARVRAVLPAPKGAPNLTPVGYTRAQDRPARNGAAPARAAATWSTKPAATPAVPDPDDPLPEIEPSDVGF